MALAAEPSPTEPGDPGASVCARSTGLPTWSSCRRSASSRELGRVLALEDAAGDLRVPPEAKAGVEGSLGRLRMAQGDRRPCDGGGPTGSPPCDLAPGSGGDLSVGAVPCTGVCTHHEIFA
jgi:hypothetical protein